MKKCLVITLGITGIIASSFFTEIDAAQIITGQEVSNNGTQVVCNQCQCTATYMTTAKTANENTEYSASWELNITDDVLNELGVEKIYNVQTNAQLHEVTDADWSKYVSDKKSESLGVQWVPGSDPCAPGVNFQTDWSKAESNKLPSHSYSDLDKTTVTVDTSVSGKVSATVNINGIQLGAGKEVTSYNCQGGGANVSTQTNLPVKFSFDFTTEENCEVAPVNCTPNAVSSLSCNSSNQLQDTNDWENCVIPNSSGLFDNNAGLGNKYCKVTCREEIKFTFPSTDTYLAGNHFMYQPIQVIGTRECRSPQLDWGTFESDFKTADENYKKHYECSMNMTTSLEWCCMPEICATTDDAGNTVYVSCCGNGEMWVASCGEHPKSCSYNAGTDPINLWKSEEMVKAESEKTKRETAETSWKKCFNWGDIYTINTTTKVNYSDPTGHYSWEGGYVAGNTSTVLKNDTQKAEDYNIKWNVCSGNTCNKQNHTVDRNKNNQKEEYIDDGSKTGKIERETRFFVMPSGIYQYILKPSGISVHAGAEYGNYVDIGYSNFPIHYSTPTGTYYIGITFENFGHKDRLNEYANGGSLSAECPYGVLNKILDEEDPPKCPIEQCNPGYTLINPDSVNCSCVGPYNNSCPISSCAPGSNLMNAGSPNCYCKKDTVSKDFEGLNIIYRPIDLNDPFPGLSGDGRLPGTNWRGYFDNYVDLYITDNRNVQTEEVYNLDPIYKITLTPQTIKAIRDYNNERKNDSLGYDDFELNCDVGTGEKCIMTTFVTRFGHIFDTGSLCLGQTGSNFDSCRY